MDSNTYGAILELRAAAWLMEHDYQVFMNVKGTGPADMVAWDSKTGEIRIIDVKTTHKYIREDGTITYHTTLGNHRNLKQLEYLGYCPEEDRFLWIEKKIPHKRKSNRKQS